MARWAVGVGMLAVLAAGATPGCVCPGKNIFTPPAVVEAPAYKAPPPPPPVVVPEQPPVRPLPPVVTPPPVIPTKTADAIEDLHQKYPGMFDFDRARGMIRFNSDITFDSGSTIVKPQAKTALTRLAGILSTSSFAASSFATAR
ncbi:MAG: hypothetical protein NTV86_10775 [Planctomycetota bacterium]|nr:hypothetical protein [Planctomycetota bacterium]